MKKLDRVKSLKGYIKGITFQIERIGEKRVSLKIIKPTPDEDGFVTKSFKSGRLESVSIYEKRVMTRAYFNKSFVRV